MSLPFGDVCRLIAVGVLSSLVGGIRCQDSLDKLAFVPAMDTGDGNIVLFSDQPRKLQLPISSGPYVLSSDGEAVYGGASLGRGGVALVRIDLKSLRITEIPGSSAFGFRGSMAVSSTLNVAVISGHLRVGGRTECGVFELNLSTGLVRSVLKTLECSDAVSRTDLSLSPDGKRAVAIHNRRLEVLDMVSGEVRNLGDGYLTAAWAPNNKWIAAGLYSSLNASMRIFDSRTLAITKTLPSSTVLRAAWSPDSQYLLARRLDAGCGPDRYTYEAFNVMNGSRSMISSSRCKVTGNDLGWAVLP